MIRIPNLLPNIHLRSIPGGIILHVLPQLSPVRDDPSRLRHQDGGEEYRRQLFVGRRDAAPSTLSSMLKHVIVFISCFYLYVPSCFIVFPVHRKPGKGAWWGFLGGHGGRGDCFCNNTPLNMHLYCVSCWEWTLNEYILIIFLFKNIVRKCC